MFEPLVVSHLSIVNALGNGARAVVEAIRTLRSGLARCDFETVALDTWIGKVQGLDEASVRPDLAAYDCRNNRLAQRCLEQDGFAENVAKLRETYGAHRIGIFVGTSTSGILQTELAYRRRDPTSGALPSDYRYAQTQNNFSVGDFARRYLQLEGPAVVVSAACSSSAKAFGNAARMIAAGVCDAAIVGGVDSLCLTTLYGFHALELVSRAPCRPFDAERDGISIGEGGGFVSLERANRRVPKPRAMLLGIGESSDAYHMSTPHPEGAGARVAMQRALACAGLRPADVDYINLHGTATRNNDSSEDRAVFDLFGAQTPCSSTKGATGHLLGAAGITEAIISMLAVEEGLLPGSAHTRNVDPTLRSRYLRETVSGRVRRVLSNSFGFGGSNCSLIFGAAQTRGSP
jgi:3-oxoacyl-[acyl-carrier-protein] synthase-1